MRGISVVIPVYNEEENVAEGFREVSSVLEPLGLPYEIIYVDDGSRDKTVATLLESVGNDPHLRLIQLRRNFGQTAAMSAGFDHSQYDDPREIPQMVAKLDEGYDLVCGWRKARRDKFISRKLPSMIANKLISYCTDVRLHDYGCTLKAMTGDVARGLRLYGEMHRFIPALANEMGAKIVEVPVNHRERKFGKSKYGISRTIRVVLDLVKFLLGYSKRPIHLFGFVGAISGLFGMGLLAMMTYQRFFQGVPMGNRPLLSLGVMMVIIGMQFMVFGLLAEVLARTYYESQNKKTYVVRRVFAGLDLDGSAPWKRKVAN
jgi:glycosyltransferase involved in cell wall biosynthesis